MTTFTEWVDIFVPVYTITIIGYIFLNWKMERSNSSNIEGRSNNISPSSSSTKDNDNSKLENDTTKVNKNIQFNGTFQLIENHNISALLAAQGMGFIRRKLASAADVIQAITMTSDHISFYINASVKGKGEITKYATYKLQSKEDQRMIQNETKLIFLDRIYFDSRGHLILIRKEQTKQFHMMVDSYLKVTNLDVWMISETTLTTSNNQIIHAKRIFKKIDDSGEQYTKHPMESNVKSKSNSNSNYKSKSKSKSILSTNTTESIQHIKASSSSSTSSSTSSSSSLSNKSFPNKTLQGKYVAINPFAFQSHLLLGMSVETSMNHAQYSLSIKHENHILQIKIPNYFDTVVNLMDTDIKKIQPIQTKIGTITIQSIAMKSIDYHDEIIVKRKFKYPKTKNHFESCIFDSKLLEILDIFKWSKSGHRLIVKNIFIFPNDQKLESIQIYERID